MTEEAPSFDLTVQSTQANSTAKIKAVVKLEKTDIEKLIEVLASKTIEEVEACKGYARDNNYNVETLKQMAAHLNLPTSNYSEESLRVLEEAHKGVC